jgi:hypothetical protein
MICFSLTRLVALFVFCKINWVFIILVNKGFICGLSKSPLTCNGACSGNTSMWLRLNGVALLLRVTLTLTELNFWSVRCSVHVSWYHHVHTLLFSHTKKLLRLTEMFVIIRIVLDQDVLGVGKSRFFKGWYRLLKIGRLLRSEIPTLLNCLRSNGIEWLVF